MSGKISRRSGGVDPFIVMDVMAAAAEKEAAGDIVIHLEVGQPSTPAPRGALAAAHAALDTERIGYVAALGMPALRERIARYYRETYGADVAPERVIVTTGSS
ncbi:MAG: pyridoxal phosphate-dependent aminotransferase, partial [Rhodospirillales bacterium]|nr:pyridoxal phosphate-dependent aminotransferase [Rhodospirillales bacterium]